MDFLVILMWIISILLIHIVLVKTLEIQTMNNSLMQKFTNKTNDKPTEYSKSDEELESELTKFIEEQDNYTNEILLDKDAQDIEDQLLSFEKYDKDTLSSKLTTDLHKPEKLHKTGSNLTLNAEYDIPSKMVVHKTDGGGINLGYKALKPDMFMYKNEKPMNGGLMEHGISAFDPLMSDNYASLT